MTKRGNPLSPSAILWFLHFAERERSGVGLRAFCRARRLSYRQARAWQLRLARTLLGPLPR